MNLTLIADTHGLHDELKLQEGEMLIHAGDITEYGNEDEAEDFLNWFRKQPFKYKIFIAGNHDLCLENFNAAKRIKIIPSEIIYLEDSFVEIEGLKIYGSPVTPYFLGMAFNKRRGTEIKRYWKKIPVGTDLLITHGPPFGFFDNAFGCEDLLERVKFVRPGIHVFGHVHGCGGIRDEDGVTFVNAAIVNNLDPLKNEAYKIIAKPIMLTL